MPLNKSTLSQFRDAAIQRANMLWFPPLDAIRVIDAAQASGIRLLGMDGAHISPDFIQPSLADSWDYSSPSSPPVEDVYEHARQFIRERSNAGLYFEIVLDEELG